MFHRFDMIGVGLHSGESVRAVVEPGPSGTGVVFVRRGQEIPAHPRYLQPDAKLCTSLVRNGIVVRTIEHLLAAIAAVGIRDVRVTINGSEIPILDGSANPWWEAFQHAGVSPKFRWIDIHHRLLIRHDGARAEIVPIRPNEVPEIHIRLDFGPTLRGNLSFRPDIDDFALLAPARTFVMEAQLPDVLAAGLAKGGSLENAVVMGRDGPLNPDGLRFENEPIRHKMLDVVGDLALAGGMPRARIELTRPGHALVHKIVTALINAPQDLGRS